MKMFSLLAAVVLFSGAAVANAAEPVALTDTQLESITAGAAGSEATARATASGSLVATTLTETNAEARFTPPTATTPAVSSASATSRSVAVAG